MTLFATLDELDNSAAEIADCLQTLQARLAPRETAHALEDAGLLLVELQHKLHWADRQLDSLRARIARLKEEIPDDGKTQ